MQVRRDPDDIEQRDDVLEEPAADARLNAWASSTASGLSRRSSASRTTSANKACPRHGQRSTTSGTVRSRPAGSIASPCRQGSSRPGVLSSSISAVLAVLWPRRGRGFCRSPSGADGVGESGRRRLDLLAAVVGQVGAVVGDRLGSFWIAWRLLDLVDGHGRDRQAGERVDLLADVVAGIADGRTSPDPAWTRRLAARSAPRRRRAAQVPPGAGRRWRAHPAVPRRRASRPRLPSRRVGSRSAARAGLEGVVDAMATAPGGPGRKRAEVRVDSPGRGRSRSPCRCGLGEQAAERAGGRADRHAEQQDEEDQAEKRKLNASRERARTGHAGEVAGLRLAPADLPGDGGGVMQSRSAALLRLLHRRDRDSRRRTRRRRSRSYGDVAIADPRRACGHDRYQQRAWIIDGRPPRASR